MGNIDSIPEDNEPLSPGHPEHPRPRSEMGSREKPVRFQGQHFGKLRHKLLRENQLFQDPNFPATEESLGVLETTGIEWIRASVLVKDPQFFVDSISTTDICQGHLGDCWFVAAMSSLSLNENLFNYVVPGNQSFQKKYAGIFRFRFWQYGKWVEVVIDDMLPTKYQMLIFTKSSTHNELWSALLEKAYAKLYGSYSSLIGGLTSVAMEDFTGGIPVDIQMSDITGDNLWVLVKRALLQQTQASCSIVAENRRELEKDNGLGLLKAHAYAIIEADKVQQGTSSVKLIRLRNPWGKREYTGPWSDRSSMWNGVSYSEKARLKLKIREDGEFWIPADALQENFTTVELCSLQPICHHSTPCNWTITSHTGRWVPGISAGGAHDKDTFSINPQFRLTLREEDDDPGDFQMGCTVNVELLQKYRRQKNKSEYLFIAFFIYTIPEKYRNWAFHFGKEFFRYHRATFESGPYTNSRSVTKRFLLPPGDYIIVPATLKKGLESEFLLRIFAKRNNMSRENSTTRTAFNPEVTWTEVDAPNTSLLKTLENAENQDRTLSAAEFMELFNSASADRYHLTFETCCSLVFTVNEPGQQGWLNSQHATQMVMHLRKLQGLFDGFVSTERHLMNSHDLRPALSAAGFELDSTVHQELWLRHRTSTNTICFSHFIGCLAKLQKLFTTFEGLKNPEPETIDQWLLLFIGI